MCVRVCVCVCVCACVFCWFLFLVFVTKCSVVHDGARTNRFNGITDLEQRTKQQIKLTEQELISFSRSVTFEISICRFVEAT